MKTLKNNPKIFTVALVLMLTIAAAFVAMPSVTAQDTWQTWCILEVVPNPVGVGQEVLVSFGLTRQTTWPQPGWYGLTVTVTKPDLTTQTLGPFTTDTTGMTGTIYVPDQTGTYKLQAHFPQQKIEVGVAGVPTNATMLADDSDIVELVVQTEPVPQFPGRALPAEYWTRPIDAQNREWYTVAGSWLSGGAWGNYMRARNRLADYNDGPESAHILWTKPYAEGGLVGGDMDVRSFETGDAYEGKWQNPIIIAGILISNRHTWGTQETFAINLRTGEELWSKELGDFIDFGQIMYWDTMNMHGCFPYIWATGPGGLYQAFDPFTGRHEYNITEVPGGTLIYGPDGELLIYSLSTWTGILRMWNSTRAVYHQFLEDFAGVPNPAYQGGRWRPMGRSFNGTKHGIQYELNITALTDLPGGVEVVLDDRIIGSNCAWSGGGPQDTPVFWAVSIKPGQEGTILFNRTWTLPTPNLHVDFAGSHPHSVEDGVFVITAKETRQHWGLSLDTGAQLWGPTTWNEPVMNVYTNLYLDPWGQSVCAYGKLFTAGMGGQVNAYDVTNGNHLWSYDIKDPYGEQLFSTNWPAPITFIADGKIYLMHMEHSVINPMPRGAPAVCLDAETGDEVWRIDGLRLGTRWGGQPRIGDSVIAAFSSYDNSIVAIGKGPSKTTITAPQTVIPWGDSIMITGHVTDVSPGTKEFDQTARFPIGVPAINDDYMSEWMLYVYQQQPLPADAVGVDVSLDTLDPNGNWIHIGTVVSDMSGMFKKMFTPEVPGEYTIIATFMGSAGYYPSYAETAIGVGPAPEEPPEYGTDAWPAYPEAPAYTTIDLVLIVAVVIVAILVVYDIVFLRRRK